jgi:hypothetical protein
VILDALRLLWLSCRLYREGRGGPCDHRREVAGRTPDPDIVRFGSRGSGTTTGVRTPCGHGSRARVRPQLAETLGGSFGEVRTFIEVPFKLEGKPVRPDGVIVVTRAGKSWSALLEAKIAAHPLEAGQINAYLDLARELDFQAVLSVSNQYVTSSTEYPIEIDRRKLRRTKLHHWSWIDLLTQATVQKEYRGISDPDQAYILGELIRYLADPRSGAVAFDGMGSG